MHGSCSKHAVVESQFIAYNNGKETSVHQKWFIIICIIIIIKNCLNSKEMHYFFIILFFYYHACVEGCVCMSVYPRHTKCWIDPPGIFCSHTFLARFLDLWPNNYFESENLQMQLLQYIRLLNTHFFVILIDNVIVREPGGTKEWDSTIFLF